METFNINYSKKIIPIPSKEEYKLLLISKVEHLLKRMRWKALAFLEKLGESNKENYGFRTNRCPPQVDEISEFEIDIMKMIKKH